MISDNLEDLMISEDLDDLMISDDLDRVDNGDLDCVSQTHLLCFCNNTRWNNKKALSDTTVETEVTGQLCTAAN